jgi:hypothetical protein
MTARNEKGKFTKNPDEEVATKGYVKCLIRKTRDHTHRNNVTIGYTGWLTACGFLIIALSTIMSCGTGRPTLSGEVWVTLLASTLICTAVTLDRINTNTETVQGVDGVEPYYIRKHTDKKKDCEE